MKKYLLLIFFFPLLVYSAKIDTLTVFSSSMQKSIKNILILPDASSENVRFPVLFLLHGASGNYTDWITQVPELKKYADHYQMIILCPDGNVSSWYIDSPVDQSSRYATYISKELLPELDECYLTIPNRNKRAITGLSMGGHGAFYLAITNQNLWGAAGSMSGGLDLRPFSGKWNLNQLLGSKNANPQHWEKYSVITLVNKLEPNKLQLLMDCGTEDFFFEVNQRVHQKLTSLHIPHTYVEKPGAHNWNYWKNSIEFHIIFFNHFFKDSL